MAEVYIKKTITDFENFVSSFAEDAVTKCYRNGFIVHVYFSNGKNLGYATETLVKCFQESDGNYVPNKNAAKTSIHDLLDKIKRLKKNVDQNWHFIEDWLLRPVHVPIPKKRKLIPDITPSGDNIEETSVKYGMCPTKGDKFKLDENSRLFFQPVKAQGTKKKKKIAHQQFDSLLVAPEKQLKSDCEKCSKRRKFYTKSISELKVKLRSSQKTLREISKNYVRVVNQNMKRKDAAIDKLRKERKALKIENLNLKLEVNMLKSLTGKENVAVPKKKKHKTPYDLAQVSLGIETLTTKIQIKEEMIQEFESDVGKLKCELTKLQEQNSVKKLTPGESEAQFQAKSKKRKHILTPEDTVLQSQEKEKTLNHEGWWEVEKFTDIPALVAIEIEEQTYITVLDNGALELWNHKDSGEGPTNPADIFTTIRINTSKVAFKSVNGKHWSLQSDGRVVSIAETVGTREQFEPVFQDGKMALIGYNNCYLSYNEDGDIVCDSCTADPKMWFKLRSNAARMKDAV